ncbi:MAG: serine protease [Henriciella sp.]|nr:serine protease [Henriciella sp.]
MIHGNPTADWGFIPVSDVEVTLEMAAVVIQHPEGGLKKTALGDIEVKHVADDKTIIQYLSDTKTGSSGSPVFNDNGMLIGVHHPEN